MDVSSIQTIIIYLEKIIMVVLGVIIQFPNIYTHKHLWVAFLQGFF